MNSSTENKFFKIAATAVCVCFIISALILSAVVTYKLSGRNSVPSVLYPSAAESEHSAFTTGGIINPDSEVRGVFIASYYNINFPSEAGLSVSELKKEIDDIISVCAGTELNAIYFQVRPCGDALYDSDIYPTSLFLTGTEGSGLPDGFDPLSYFVERAHAQGIKLHAWINPFRITYGSSSKPRTDINLLSQNNPARLHPEWTVPYADGILYYNPGLPEVRALIFDGVAEIVRNYDVDGIIIDDYFYPYPVKGADFEDRAAYLAYGAGKNIEEWRRENVNLTVKGIYDTVKSINDFCEFGVAPFGIWQNDNGKNGGSDTNGMEAYHSLYCDALAWAEGGYVDYIAPQIYWEFTTAAARFGEVARWWNAKLSEYPGVDFLVSHAAYKSADYAAGEMQNQVEFARAERCYRGSIMYGYEAIKNNEGGVKDQLKNVFRERIIYSDIVSDGTLLYIESPTDGITLGSANTYLIGKCDPAYPLYFNDQPVSYTKNGYFSVYVPLKDGKNVFTFKQNGTTCSHTVYRSTSTVSGYDSLRQYTIASFFPGGDALFRSGDEITLKVTAPSGCRVTASFNGNTYSLFPTINPPQESTYMKEVYVGTLSLNGSFPDGSVTDCGKIKYSVKGSYGDLEAYSGNVRIAGRNAYVVVEAAKDDAELKIAPNSWYYDDYTPTTVGMRDLALRLSDGYYELRMGGYISASDVKEQTGEVEIAKLARPEIEVGKKTTVIRFPSSENVPANGYISNGIFYISLFNTDTVTATLPELGSDNPLFTEVSLESKKDENRTVYALKLHSLENYYGFDYKYKDGSVVFTFRNPSIALKTDKPLSGKLIVLDPGHGGRDPGASGPDAVYHEAQVNYDIASSAKQMLEELGAEVIMTRNGDETVELMDRVYMISEIEPDLCISIHQNSADYSADIRKINGLVGLYYAYSGYSLVNDVSDSLSFSLRRVKRNVTGQRLAITRNEEFPSCLFEFGFMTCPEEFEQMRFGSGISDAARGISEGVVKYFKNQSKYAYTLQDGRLQSFRFSKNFAALNGSYFKHIFELISFRKPYGA